MKQVFDDNKGKKFRTGQDKGTLMRFYQTQNNQMKEMTWNQIVTIDSGTDQWGLQCEQAKYNSVNPSSSKTLWNVPIESLQL